MQNQFFFLWILLVTKLAEVTLLHVLLQAHHALALLLAVATLNGVST